VAAPPPPPSSDPQFQVQTVNPEQYGADAFVKQIMAMLQPQFQQQNRGLEESLAANGIVGGSSTGAYGQLAGQQETTALGDIAPLENEAMSRQAGLSEFDASQYNTANLDVLGMNNQDWLAQLGLQSPGQYAGAYDPIYSQPGGTDFTGFGSGIGQFGTPPATGQTPPPYQDPSGSYPGGGMGGL
jgi:hypothetical protein